MLDHFYVFPGLRTQIRSRQLCGCLNWRKFIRFLELMLAYEGVCCPKAELCADYLDPVCDQMG
jgi:hypothetical protein